jgi:hypothetical protein
MWTKTVDEEKRHEQQTPRNHSTIPVKSTCSIHQEDGKRGPQLQDLQRYRQSHQHTGQAREDALRMGRWVDEDHGQIP